jgi:hypothetical protein
MRRQREMRRQDTYFPCTVEHLDRCNRCAVDVYASYRFTCARNP